MKFDLKEYQEEATDTVIAGLRKGSAEYEADGEHTAVSLSAPTGAGKTVIAAAVIERMLFGDADGDVPGDPDAVILWLTDDPSLNEQTRKKILEASDRIQSAHLVTLDDGFDSSEFERGKVYFLNIQKLSRTSKLVIKREGRRTHSLWETIKNTVASDGSHYYLIIDEAHRGTGKRSREDQTIAQRLMNGNGMVTAAPVVLGISATPDRFDTAVANGTQERVPRKVVVPVAAVRESGLIKDTLSISYRAEVQVMETTLVRKAAATLRQVDAEWLAYTESEGEPPVRPVLVLQIPANESADHVGELLDVCEEEWDEFGRRKAIAHCLESHTAEEFGNYVVNYVKPQNIQDHASIRMVIFKEALTTGWDCPRAEVMVSLRRAKDDTYIAQLMGRMVRSPLARRIESYETLNRVRLYLPHFDERAVMNVKNKLETDEGGLPTDVEIDSVDATRNSAVPAESFGLIESLASYQVPGTSHRSQVTRLHKFAALLVGDGLLPNAIEAADEFLVAVLNTEYDRLYADGTMQSVVSDIKTATSGLMDIYMDGTVRRTTEEFDTDVADLNRIFSAAKRRLRDGLAARYWAYRVTALGEDSYEAKVVTVVLSQDASAEARIEAEAAGRVRQWFDTYGDAVALLSEDKKAKYAEVRAMAREPELVHPGLPKGPISMPGDRSVDPYAMHLYSDRRNRFRVKLGTWEKHALEVERSRSGFAAWYRNPTGGQRALRIPFETGNGFGKMYVDLLVLHYDDEGTLHPSIVDPHGHHLGDAGDKLRGLAHYAQRHGEDYARILSVMRNGDGNYRMLDLKDATVRSSLTDVNGKEAIEHVFKVNGSMYN